MANGVLRVLVVDDHELVRAGIKVSLDSEADLTVVGEAASAQEAVAEAERCHPDVVTMDIRLGRESGIEATREIRSCCPATRVVMLTSFGEDEAVFASIMAGASGFVLKSISERELVSAIRMVGRGQSLLDPAVTAAVLNRLRDQRYVATDEKLATLSSKQLQVLELMAEGRTNRQISRALYLAEKTVRNYVSDILAKLEVARRAEAVAYLARIRQQ